MVVRFRRQHDVHTLQVELLVQWYTLGAGGTGGGGGLDDSKVL